MNCCACSDPFPALLPQLFQGIKTSANCICADWSKCWALVRIFIPVCVYFLFIQKVCLPFRAQLCCFWKITLKHIRCYHHHHPGTGDPAVQQLPRVLSGRSAVSQDEVPVQRYGVLQGNAVRNAEAGDENREKASSLLLNCSFERTLLCSPGLRVYPQRSGISLAWALVGQETRQCPHTDPDCWVQGRSEPTRCIQGRRIYSTCAFL